MKYIIIDDLKFTKDEKTGYYLCSKIHKRLHRYIYEKYKGKIPKGYVTHHKDQNKDNNDILNLELLTKKEHNKIHSKLLTKEERNKRAINVKEKALPQAIEWHKSELGKQKAKEVFNRFGYNYYFKKIDKVCECCGKHYFGYQKSKFCSNKCKSKNRRNLGIDNIIVRCEICGKEYTKNKYSKARKCIMCRGKKH